MRWFTFSVATVLATLAHAAPAPTPSPWSMVPAFPTSSYSGDGDYAKKIRAAREAVDAEVDKQQKKNDELAASMKTSMKIGAGQDPFAAAAEMQRRMMSDPEAVKRLLQQSQNAGNTVATDATRDEDNRKQLAVEFNSLTTQYRAAFAKAVAPVDAKFKDLDNRAQKSLVVSGESWVYAPWAVQEYDALATQYNSEVEKNCATWFGASGPFQSWLKRYREHLIADHIPWLRQSEDAGNDFNAFMASNTDNSHKSTAELRAVSEYLRQVAAVFDNRPLWPKPSYNAHPGLH